MRADYAVCDLAAAAKREGPRTWYLGGYDQRLSSYLQDKSRSFFIGNFVPYNKTLRGIALWRNGTVSQLRPAAGGESRKRDTFFYERKIYFPNLSRIMEAGMYNKVDANLNFVDREKQVEKFWEENDIFRKSMENRKDGETYTFYDGPPTANGKPHIGHVLTRVIKDMIPRYQTMKGKYVPRKAGWDTHGLPVELEVEKLLGLNGKEQIKNTAWSRSSENARNLFGNIRGCGRISQGPLVSRADMDDPYVTYDDNFIESEWWALKQIWDKKLLYKGFKIVPYCPRCGTPLSSQEVAQGYKSVKERSAVVRFKVVGEDAYFLAWTTTPWTLPSNVALCVNPDETYCKVKAADGCTYYMAQALLDQVLGKLAGKEDDNEAGEKKVYEILETCTGRDLEYKEMSRCLHVRGEAAAKQKKKGHFVTCDSYVTMSDGTGIVHIAPAFGEDDAQVGRNYDLPFVQFVDGKGELTKETP